MKNYPFLDKFRIVLHFLRCIMHLSVPFMVMPSIVWPIRAASGHSEIADGFVFLVHVMVMESFFVMNGFFAMVLLSKKSHKTFIVNRLRRVGVPFLLGIIFLVPFIMSLGFSWQQQKTIIEVFPQVIASFQHFTFSFAHLWSLWYLMIIYGVFLILLKIKVLKTNELLQKMTWQKILLLVITIASISLILFPRKYTLLPLQTLGDWQMLLYFFAFFMLGVWCFWHKEKLDIDIPLRKVWFLFFAALILNILFQKTENPTFVLKIIGSLAYVLQAVCSLILFWQAMKKWSWQPKFLSIYSQSMYWIYWIEVPIALTVHYFFVDSIPALLLIGVTTFFTFIIGYFSYQKIMFDKKLGKILGF